MNQTSKKAVLYLRVSTEEQVDNFSLGIQDEICRKEAERQHYQIDKSFREEGKSAKNIAGRPELIKMLEYCRRNKKKIKAVIVYRLDRVSRSTSDYLAVRKKLNDYGISIISATEPTGNGPTEKLIETILAGFAQLDNDIRGERARNGMYARFKSGLTSSPAPFGYIKVNGYALKDKASFDKLRKAWELMSTGTKSTVEMVEIMNKWGFKRVKDGKKYKLTYKFLLNLFRSKFYAGILESKTYKEEARGQHVPMITMETFLKVQEILDGRNSKKVDLNKRNVNNEDFPLRRFIKCSKCNYCFTGSWSRGRCGKRYAYYFCGNCNGNKYTPVSVIHNAVKQFLKEVNLDKIALLLSLLTNSVFKNRCAKLKERQRIANNQLQKLSAQRQSLIDKNLTGIYSDDVFKEQFKIVDEQLKNMMVLKDSLTLDEYAIENIRNYIKDKMDNLSNIFDKLDVKQKRTLISFLFPNGFIWNYPGLRIRK